jgi:hypothetical protein
MGKASSSKQRNAVAQVRAKQHGSSWVARGTVAVLIVFGLGLVAVSATSRDSDGPDVPRGTQVTEVSSSAHVDGPVEYPETPPVGGDHAAAWQNCGTYSEPVADENGVHSLEHGTVWITYPPDLAADEISALEARASGETHVLVTPYPGLDSPIVLSAWGRQLRVDSADDERIDEFVRAFQQGPQTPELGATCSGAIGTPQ